MNYREILANDEFKRDGLFKKPFAVPGGGEDLRKLIGWPLLIDIFESGHANCWLAKKGKLHSSVSEGRLDLATAQAGFADGFTVVVRHSELAHPALREIADYFQKLYARPVDIQLYCTPSGEQGFDWHYDLEDVFIFQSSGLKEFYLRANTRAVPPAFSTLPRPIDLVPEMSTEEQRCVLKAGDFLYIPSGHWHCAIALAPSFHLSVGVAFRDC